MPSRLFSLHLAFATFLLLSHATAQLVATTSVTRHGIEDSPLSAEFVNQRSTVLADGNRIEQETHEKFYRDSEGRTRTEHEMVLANGQRHQMVMINDVVKGMNISLDPDRKTAQVHQYSMLPPTAAPSRPQVPLQNRSVASPKSENLGQMTLEGVDAFGTRTTWTTEANVIGNSQPIVRVTETWFSPELRMPVLTKHSDPQNGDSTRKLVSLVRSEPDPALFRIPSDYTVTQISETLPQPR